VISTGHLALLGYRNLEGYDPIFSRIFSMANYNIMGAGHWSFVTMVLVRKQLGMYDNKGSCMCIKAQESEKNPQK
jgi:hypothetical protein